MADYYLSSSKLVGADFAGAAVCFADFNLFNTAFALIEAFTGMRSVVDFSVFAGADIYISILSGLSRDATCG